MNWVLRAALAVMCAASLSGPALSQTFEVSAASRKALGISTVPVLENGTIEGTSAFGTVMAPPGNAHPVVSPFEAVLLQPYVIPGMQVKAGEAVALLYSPDFETARADLEAQRIMVEHMDHLYERTLELHELGLRSAQETDEAEHDTKTARLELNAQRARLSALRSAKGAGRFELVAPATGIVSEISVEAGDAVGMSEPFLSIFDGQRYWLDAVLPERLASTIRVGSAVTVPGTPDKASVIAIDPQVDAHLQSVRIKIELPKSGTWRLGQLVDLSFEAPEQAAAFVAPARALVRIGGTDGVFVDTGDGFRRVEVEVVSRSRDEVVLRGDLASGDHVAVSGLAALKNLAEGA
ncbi:MAG: efflux RND transporter periplasmic adaptor subunit [Hyphomonas sp.]